MELRTFKPLADRLVVKRAEIKEKTDSGIMLVVESSDKPVEGTVVAAGEGKVLADGTVQALKVKVGDQVLFGKYSGAEAKIDDETFTIMREDDVLGVFAR